jgi:methionyl-tRNA formyltransferase
MRITLITQSDPFYLAQNIEQLIKKLPNHSKIVSTVLLSPSPFGEKNTFFGKMRRTYSVFGICFFIRYSILFILNIFNPRRSVKRVLKSNNISVIKLKQSINYKESLSLIKSYNPDILVSIAGNQIFRLPLIKLSKYGCLNLHSSLLPKYRGLMPSFWVLKNNERKTGVSVFFVDENIDSGPILVQKEIEIGDDLSQAKLIKLTKRIGMEAIVEAIDMIHYNQVKTIPNPDDDMTYFSFPTRDDVKSFLKSGKKFY